jgi:hypothetical protein
MIILFSDPGTVGANARRGQVRHCIFRLPNSSSLSATNPGQLRPVFLHGHLSQKYIAWLLRVGRAGSRVGQCVLGKVMQGQFSTSSLTFSFVCLFVRFRLPS